MIKVAIINHALTAKRYKRWELLAQKYPDFDVYLIVPESYTAGTDKRLTFGVNQVIQGTQKDTDNFHIRTIDMVQHKYRSWTSKKMCNVLCEINPDVMYFIGVHTMETLQDVISIRNRYLKSTKLCMFSMRGKYQSLKKKKYSNFVLQAAGKLWYMRRKYMLERMNKNCDAIFCHYPDGMNEFRVEGYTGPVYMQTQVGVDADEFYPNEGYRKAIRDKYNIGDSFCFGSASRFNPSKGLFDIIAALPKDYDYKFLMMGSGLADENEAIKEAIHDRGLDDKIILTGFINLDDMPKYWNAVDCAIHVPKTTPNWEETFSLALTQAMATSLPVIGSSSGSVPYQIGSDGIIVPEGDIAELSKKIVYILEHRKEAKEIGIKMFDRATKCFDIKHLNDCFHDTIIDVYNGKHDEQKVDMAVYKVDL